jgi:hypothetical protein
MNRFKRITTFLTLGSFVLLLSCKKYPEDGIRYWLKSPEKRIEGTWLLTNYFINKGDSTNYLYNQYDGFNFAGSPTPASQYGNLLLEIVKEENSSQYNLSINSISGSGNLSFTNFKNDVEISFLVTGYKQYPAVNNGDTLYNLFRSTSFWKIEELTNINFKITNTINDTVYSIYFSK